MLFHAYAAHEVRGELKPFEYDPGPLGETEIEIQVQHCGICHSDLCMLDNEWQVSQYPIVPGHEVAGTVAAVGRNVTRLQRRRSGRGRLVRQQLHGCRVVPAGRSQPVLPSPGYFRIAGPLRRVRRSRPRSTSCGRRRFPPRLDIGKAGPLFCGGITVFNPILQADVKPVDRVGSSASAAWATWPCSSWTSGAAR